MTTLNNECSLFNICHTKWRNHYKVHSADGTQLFFADNSSFTPGKPDLTFHSGSDDKGPIVSVSKFVHFSRSIRIGLGDPANPNGMTWEELSCPGFLHTSKYRMETTIPDGYGGFCRRSFIWKCPAFKADHDLVDEQTGEPIAHFDNSVFSLSKDGKLYIYRSYGQAFELMVITANIALIERRRRANSGGGSGGGGGGGG
ncbi:hypothetical protein PHISCL_01819 [Aspergillus sclerotialis]|uniref:Uncharacterized protein n=1 Tax=Aspergillus sclerotialis TaxID=2070753 RepID=A0A3A2ZU40_9EURO|nr:hypothetical protein PHISCL_01819 [Aspergillus sclerotialis]